VTGLFFACTRVPVYPGSGTDTPGVGYGRAGHGLPAAGIINTLAAVNKIKAQVCRFAIKPGE